MVYQHDLRRDWSVCILCSIYPLHFHEPCSGRAGFGHHFHAISQKTTEKQQFDTALKGLFDPATIMLGRLSRYLVPKPEIDKAMVYSKKVEFLFGLATIVIFDQTDDVRCYKRQNASKTEPTEKQSRFAGSHIKHQRGRIRWHAAGLSLSDLKLSL